MTFLGKEPGQRSGLALSDDNGETINESGTMRLPEKEPDHRDCRTVMPDNNTNLRASCGWHGKDASGLQGLRIRKFGLSALLPVKFVKNNLQSDGKSVIFIQNLIRTKGGQVLSWTKE